jgi:hypothetical protein
MNKRKEITVMENTKKIGRNDLVRLTKNGEVRFVKAKKIHEYTQDGWVKNQRPKFKNETTDLSNFVDRFVSNRTEYHVPIIQRRRYFGVTEKRGYIKDLFSGDNISDFMFTDLKALRVSYSEIGDRIQKVDREYFSEIWEAGKTFQSVDGNNRMGALFSFFGNEFTLLKGSEIPVVNIEGELDLTIINKNMTHQDIVNEYGDEYLKALEQIDIGIKWLTFTTKNGLYKIFRNVNKIKKLNKQQDRNCIDVEIAETVREIGVYNEAWFEKVLSEASVRNLDDHSFTAFSLFIIDNFNVLTNSEFNSSALENITETSVTEMYEEDNVSDKTINEFKSLLKRVKQYGKLCGGETNFLSSKLFRIALISWFKRLKENYSSIDWDNVLKSTVEFDKQNVLSTKIYFCFGNNQDTRTYSEIRKSGISYFNILFSFFVTQEELLVSNGYMFIKNKRKNTNTLRQKLYTLQSGICTLTNNDITDYNDTSLYEVDHITPISKWDSDEDVNGIDNLQLVEKSANRKKSNN